MMIVHGLKNYVQYKLKAIAIFSEKPFTKRPENFKCECLDVLKV